MSNVEVIGVPSDDHEKAVKQKMLPCSNCGTELFGREKEETTAMVDVTPEPVFAGKKGQREVPAYVCPDCGEVTAL